MKNKKLNKTLFIIALAGSWGCTLIYVNFGVNPILSGILGGLTAGILFPSPWEE